MTRLRVLKFLKELLKLRPPYCLNCGSELERAVGWHGKYKCPESCPPENYSVNNGIMVRVYGE